MSLYGGSDWSSCSRKKRTTARQQRGSSIDYFYLPYEPFRSNRQTEVGFSKLPLCKNTPLYARLLRCPAGVA